MARSYQVYVAQSGGFEPLRNNVTLDVLARKVRRKMRMFPACVTQYKYKYKCQFKIYL